MITCPRCRVPFDVRIMGLTSNLGPSKIVCRGCQLIITTDRKEWGNMSTSERNKFILLSGLYTLAVTGMGTMLTFCGYGFLIGQKVGTDFPIPFIACTITFWLIFVVLIQRIRVSISEERLSKTRGLPMKLPYLNLNFNQQIYFCFYMSIPLIIGGVVDYFRGQTCIFLLRITVKTRL